MFALDVSLIPVVSLIVALVAVTMLLKILGSTVSQAMEHYELICSARSLRNSHIRRLREIEETVKRETDARNAERQRRLAPPTARSDEEVGVDVLEAA